MNRKILIVDHDPLARAWLARFFRVAGFRAATARDGETGLRLALTARPAAIVCDHRLPNLDGASMLERIRHVHAPAHEMITILFTASISCADLQRAEPIHARLMKGFHTPEDVIRVTKRPASKHSEEY